MELSLFRLDNIMDMDITSLKHLSLHRKEMLSIAMFLMVFVLKLGYNYEKYI